MIVAGRAGRNRGRVEPGGGEGRGRGRGHHAAPPPAMAPNGEARRQHNGQPRIHVPALRDTSGLVAPPPQPLASGGNPYGPYVRPPPPAPIDEDDGDVDEGDGEIDLTGVEAKKTLAKATEAYNKFVKAWNAKHPNNKKKLFKSLKKEHIVGVLDSSGAMENPTDPPIRAILAWYAEQLLSVPLVNNGKKFFKPNVMKQYFTTLKADVFRRYRVLSKADGTKPEWYIEILSRLKLRAVTEAIGRGEKVSKKAVGFARKALSECCEFLMKQTNGNVGAEERAVLLMLYHAVGRGGEVSSTSWDLARWNDEVECLLAQWGETKKGQQYGMSFHPDASNWRVCIFNALACYLILTGGSPDRASVSSAEAGVRCLYRFCCVSIQVLTPIKVHWIFPSFVNLVEGGAAKKASKILEKCRAGGVKRLPKDSTSHGIRVSATDDMIHNHLVSVFVVIARGGWDFEADSTAFRYFSHLKHVAVGGRALAGWSDPNLGVKAPSLDPLFAIVDRHVVRNFCDILFSATDIPQLKNEDELLPFRDVMVATLLKDYEPMFTTLGANSPIIRKMQNAAIHVNKGHPDLVKWGRAIKSKFRLDNLTNLGDNRDENIRRVLDTVQRHMVEKDAEIRELKVRPLVDNLNLKLAHELL